MDDFMETILGGHALEQPQETGTGTASLHSGTSTSNAPEPETWCSSCASLAKQMEERYAKNFMSMKQKILFTEKLIRMFQEAKLQLQKSEGQIKSLTKDKELAQSQLQMMLSNQEPTDTENKRLREENTRMKQVVETLKIEVHAMDESRKIHEETIKVLKAQDNSLLNDVRRKHRQQVAELKEEIAEKTEGRNKLIKKNKALQDRLRAMRDRKKRQSSRSVSGSSHDEATSESRKRGRGRMRRNSRLSLEDLDELTKFDVTPPDHSESVADIPAQAQEAHDEPKREKRIERSPETSQERIAYIMSTTTDSEAESNMAKESVSAMQLKASKTLSSAPKSKMTERLGPAFPLKANTTLESVSSAKEGLTMQSKPEKASQSLSDSKVDNRPVLQPKLSNTIISESISAKKEGKGFTVQSKPDKALPSLSDDRPASQPKLGNTTILESSFTSNESKSPLRSKAVKASSFSEPRQDRTSIPQPKADRVNVSASTPVKKQETKTRESVTTPATKTQLSDTKKAALRNQMLEVKRQRALAVFQGKPSLAKREEYVFFMKKMKAKLTGSYTPITEANILELVRPVLTGYCEQLFLGNRERMVLKRFMKFHKGIFTDEEVGWLKNAAKDGAGVQFGASLHSFSETSASESEVSHRGEDKSSPEQATKKATPEHDRVDKTSNSHEPVSGYIPMPDLNDEPKVAETRDGDTKRKMRYRNDTVPAVAAPDTASSSTNSTRNQTTLHLNLSIPPSEDSNVEMNTPDLNTPDISAEKISPSTAEPSQVDFGPTLDLTELEGRKENENSETPTKLAMQDAGMPDVTDVDKAESHDVVPQSEVIPDVEDVLDSDVSLVEGVNKQSHNSDNSRESAKSDSELPTEQKNSSESLNISSLQEEQETNETNTTKSSQPDNSLLSSIEQEQSSQNSECNEPLNVPEPITNRDEDSVSMQEDAAEETAKPDPGVSDFNIQKLKSGKRKWSDNSLGEDEGGAFQEPVSTPKRSRRRTRSMGLEDEEKSPLRRSRRISEKEESPSKLDQTGRTTRKRSSDIEQTCNKVPKPSSQKTKVHSAKQPIKLEADRPAKKFLKQTKLEKFITSKKSLKAKRSVVDEKVTNSSPDVIDLMSSSDEDSLGLSGDFNKKRSYTVSDFERIFQEMVVPASLSPLPDVTMMLQDVSDDDEALLLDETEAKGRESISPSSDLCTAINFAPSRKNLTRSTVKKPLFKSKEASIQKSKTKIKTVNLKRREIEASLSDDLSSSKTKFPSSSYSTDILKPRRFSCEAPEMAVSVPPIKPLAKGASFDHTPSRLASRDLRKTASLPLHRKEGDVPSHWHSSVRNDVGNEFSADEIEQELGSQRHQQNYEMSRTDEAAGRYEDPAKSATVSHERQHNLTSSKEEPNIRITRTESKMPDVDPEQLEIAEGHPLSDANMAVDNFLSNDMETETASSMDDDHILAKVLNFQSIASPMHGIDSGSDQNGRTAVKKDAVRTKQHGRRKSKNFPTISAQDAMSATMSVGGEFSKIEPKSSQENVKGVIPNRQRKPVTKKTVKLSKNAPEASGSNAATEGGLEDGKAGSGKDGEAKKIELAEKDLNISHTKKTNARKKSTSQQVVKGKKRVSKKNLEHAIKFIESNSNKAVRNSLPILAAKNAVVRQEAPNQSQSVPYTVNAHEMEVAAPNQPQIETGDKSKETSESAKETAPKENLAKNSSDKSMETTPTAGNEGIKDVSETASIGDSIGKRIEKERFGITARMKRRAAVNAKSKLMIASMQESPDDKRYIPPADSDSDGPFEPEIQSSASEQHKNTEVPDNIPQDSSRTNITHPSDPEQKVASDNNQGAQPQRKIHRRKIRLDRAGAPDPGPLPTLQDTFANLEPFSAANPVGVGPVVKKKECLLLDSMADVGPALLEVLKKEDLEIKIGEKFLWNCLVSVLEEDYRHEEYTIFEKIKEISPDEDISVDDLPDGEQKFLRAVIAIQRTGRYKGNFICDYVLPKILWFLAYFGRMFPYATKQDKEAKSLRLVFIQFLKSGRLHSQTLSNAGTLTIVRLYSFLCRAIKSHHLLMTFCDYCLTWKTTGVLFAVVECIACCQELGKQHSELTETALRIAVKEATSSANYRKPLGPEIFARASQLMTRFGWNHEEPKTVEYVSKKLEECLARLKDAQVTDAFMAILEGRRNAPSDLSSVRVFNETTEENILCIRILLKDSILRELEQIIQSKIWPLLHMWAQHTHVHGIDAEDTRKVSNPTAAALLAVLAGLISPRMTVQKCQHKDQPLVPHFRPTIRVLRELMDNFARQYLVKAPRLVQCATAAFLLRVCYCSPFDISKSVRTWLGVTRTCTVLKTTEHPYTKALCLLAGISKQTLKDIALYVDMTNESEFAHSLSNMLWPSRAVDVPILIRPQ